jgi:hypothetical protein
MKIVKKILLLFFITACASKLREEKDLGETPAQMTQKIEDTSGTISDAADSDTPASSGKKSGKASAKSTAVTPPVRRQTAGFVDFWPFSVGEKATYVLRYGPIEGGKATIEVAPVKKIDGEYALHYVTTATSHKVFDLFYRVADVLQTWTRLKDHLPLRQEITQNESGEWGRRIVIFNQKKKEQHFFSSTNRPGKPVKVIDEKHPLHNNPQDMLGSYFFSRFVKDPKKITFPVHDRFKHWNNEYVFDGKEEVKTKAGTFMCNRFKVFPRVQGNLEPKGDALVWMTDDNRRIMTRFNVKIKIGSITGDLVAYEPGRSWDLPIPEFATPLNLDPSKVVENDQ